MFATLRGHWRWLREFPRKRRLWAHLALVLLAVLLPLLPAMAMHARGTSAQVIALMAIGYESCLFLLLFFFVAVPLMRELHAIASACGLVPADMPRRGSLLALMREITAYIRTSEERQDRVQLLQKQAELDALQSQINPHFLYNTLDTIRGQALEEGCQIAPDMLEALSTLLRYTISHRDDMVPLRQELRSIDNYMKIQQFRFSNRFRYATRIEEGGGDLLSYRIPKLTLQPLIENAIFHGIESLRSGGLIQVEIYETQSRLVINVSDNGVGMDEEQLERLRKRIREAGGKPAAEASPRRGTGLALSNIHARIQLAFGREYGLLVYSTKGIGSQFQVSLPIVEDA